MVKKYSIYCMKKYVSIYLIVQILFFLAIKIVDFSSNQLLIGLMKFSFIVVNVCSSLVFYLIYGKKTEVRNNLISLAVCLTIFGDLFLILIPTFSNWPYSDLGGYISFSVVEFIIACHLGFSKKSISFLSLWFVAIFLVIWKIGLLNLENGIALINLSLLSSNCLFGWIRYSKCKSLSNLLFAIGITSFFGCDYSIAMRIIFADYKTVSYVFNQFVWFFYVPAHILLVLSYIKSAKSDKIAE